jgi:hydroxymethylpyrimidine pyrophosphatase-like HAD family hydrolase
LEPCLDRQLPVAAALLIDLDGTILDAEDRISERTARSIRVAARKIPVGIASGRFPQDVGYFARLLGLHSPQITDNGSRLLGVVTGRTIHDLPIAEGEARGIIDRLERDGASYYGVDSGCMVRSVSWFNEWRVTIITCAVSDRAEAESIVDDQTDSGVIAMCSVGSSGKWVVDDTHSEAHKGYGARLFAEQVGVGLDSVLAIGDGLNDLEMLDAVGILVAMGHASDEARRRALHITGTLEEDGVAQPTEQFVP